MSAENPSDSPGPSEEEEEEEDPDVPEWDDEYLDRVSDRLLFNYDLERDRVVRGERFAMYGEMQMHHQKHFLHPMLSYAHHDTFDHVFARRAEEVTVADLESLVELGHDLAGDWIEADEEHYATEFTFAVVTDRVPGDVREFVAGFRDRTMLKRGFNGHYEIHLLAVAPDEEDLVASERAQLDEAFRLWEPIEERETTWWTLLKRRLQV